MELLPLLCALGLCCSLVLGNEVKAFAPEDLDGSGDDDDFSGSGEDILDIDPKVEETSVSQVEPTDSSTVSLPDIAVEEESEVEHTTKPMETTRPHDIEDIFAVEEPSEEGVFINPTTQEPLIVGTAHDPSTQQPFVAESDDEGEKKHHHHHHHHTHTTAPVTSKPDGDVAVDTVVEEDATMKPTPPQATTEDAVDMEKKHHHHHHHHHHHPHHHTTTPTESDVDEVTTASTDVEKPFVIPEETTTSTPDEESEVEEATTQAPDDSVHQEVASGSSSTPYAEEETTTLQPDVGDVPIMVDAEDKSTVAEENPTEQVPHPTSTAAPSHGYDIIEENAGGELEADHDQHVLTTTTPAEDKHYYHHPYQPTTTSSTRSSTLENDLIVDSHDSKGRRLNVPHVETTPSVPTDEEEPVPEGMDPVDSSEGSSGDTEPEETFFVEATVPAVKKDRVDSVPEEGSSDASHGIMDRKELLAGIIAGGVAGLVFAASLVAFVLYRMKKKDEGSYALEEPKQSNGGYQKPREQREFYA